MKYTANSYSSHLLDIVTVILLPADSDNDSVVTAVGSLVTVLPADINNDYTVTVLSLCSHSVQRVTDGIVVLLCMQ